MQRLGILLDSASFCHPARNLRRQSFEFGRKFNIPVYSVASTNGGVRDSNPVLHGVPLCVIPNQQVLASMVRQPS